MNWDVWYGPSNCWPKTLSAFLWKRCLTSIQLYMSHFLAAANFSPVNIITNSKLLVELILGCTVVSLIGKEYYLNQLSLSAVPKSGVLLFIPNQVGDNITWLKRVSKRAWPFSRRHQCQVFASYFATACWAFKASIHRWHSEALHKGWSASKISFTGYFGLTDSQDTSQLILYKFRCTYVYMTPEEVLFGAVL